MGSPAPGGHAYAPFAAAPAVFYGSVAMRPLPLVFALLLAGQFGPALAAQPAAAQFEALAGLSTNELATQPGRNIEVDVDLSASPGFTVELAGERAAVLYRMAFNQIAEGWSWRPLADAANEDYYHFKFLPLQSVVVDKAGYVEEDKIGEAQQMQVRWRYDYFLAFDNLYDFYRRVVDDDAGFSAELPAAAAGHLGLRAKAHLVEPVISESTTFWKATFARPVDFTLKKRYLVGVLDEVAFVDTESGRVLCRIAPGHDHCAAP
jgi:hypothetical protein